MRTSPSLSAPRRAANAYHLAGCTYGESALCDCRMEDGHQKSLESSAADMDARRKDSYDSVHEERGSHAQSSSGELC